MQAPLDTLIRMWLMDEATKITTSAVVGVTWQMLLGAEPMRFATLFNSNAGSMVFYQFSDATPVSVAGEIGMAAGQQPLLLTYDMIGQPIRYPIWIKAGAASSNCAATTYCFNPARWAKVSRYINEYLSG